MNAIDLISIHIDQHFKCVAFSLPMECRIAGPSKYSVLVASNL